MDNTFGLQNITSNHTVNSNNWCKNILTNLDKILTTNSTVTNGLEFHQQCNSFIEIVTLFIPSITSLSLKSFVPCTSSKLVTAYLVNMNGSKKFGPFTNLKELNDIREDEIDSYSLFIRDYINSLPEEECPSTFTYVYENAPSSYLLGTPSGLNGHAIANDLRSCLPTINDIPDFRICDTRDDMEFLGFDHSYCTDLCNSLIPE